MDQIATLRASHSHLFRGARLIAEVADLASGGGVEVLILFSDGSTAEAECSAEDEGYRLIVEPYTTVAGTRIGRATWLLDQVSPAQFTVRARQP